MNERKYNVYINRELSWLKFNERVLEEAAHATTPVFERLRFHSIYCNNLDEFYMVRMGSLLDQTLLKKKILDSKTGMTPEQQIDEVNNQLQAQAVQRDYVYWEGMKELSHYGMNHVAIEELETEDKAYLEAYFMEQIFPLLSPQIIDTHHPFPFLENKKLYIGVSIRSKNNNIKLGVVPIDKYFERVVYIPHQNQVKCVLIEELIYWFLEHVFKENSILSKMIFRITRNADINVEDDSPDVDIDYRQVMQELLKKRKKLAAVRLEIYKGDDDKVIKYLCDKLELKPNQVFVRKSPLDMSFVFELEKKLPTSESLTFKPLVPQQPKSLNKSEAIYKQIQKKDIVLHYPYESMNELIRLLEESAVDEEVISIKITLYRMASDSKIMNALVKAAERGIDVSVVVELRARFDEESNIEWSKQLEEAGCKVVYGLEGFKVHSKLLLITRKSGKNIQYITHIGTGNFNEKTAKIYTDVCLLTARKEIGVEASMIFNSLFLGDFVTHTEHLLVAPKCLKNRIIELIDNEIAYAQKGHKAEIILKINSLTDKALINKLIEASRAGVKIQMIIRGICCLRTGVEGFTENISVRSIVGRFLEHSRIYVFGSGDRTQIYISSADFMTRNTEKRVEVAAPIYDESNKQEILEWLDIMLKDNVKARVQTSDGNYALAQTQHVAIDSQMYFYKKAYEQANDVHSIQVEQPSKLNFIELLKGKTKIFSDKKTKYHREKTSSH